jgi:preprotein translocase subunit SecE
MIKKYLQESLQELHKVTWPTKKKAVRITTIVLIFMLISAVLLGVVDQVLTVGYKALLNIKLF